MTFRWHTMTPDKDWCIGWKKCRAERLKPVAIEAGVKPRD